MPSIDASACSRSAGDGIALARTRIASSAREARGTTPIRKRAIEARPRGPKRIRRAKQSGERSTVVTTMRTSCSSALIAPTYRPGARIPAGSKCALIARIVAIVDGSAPHASIDARSEVPPASTVARSNARRTAASKAVMRAANVAIVRAEKRRIASPVRRSAMLSACSPCSRATASPVRERVQAVDGNPAVR